MSLSVLVACEESQTVTRAFRKRGHRAYSCDMKPCRFTDNPEWHIMSDVFEVIHGHTTFCTQDGETKDDVVNSVWDLIIAHPPCTYLTVTGNRWFLKEYGASAERREREREDAIAFFMDFTKVKCGAMAIENPIGCMSKHYRKPDQIIQPYCFGERYRKATCLWLTNLPKLESTNIVEPEIYYYVAKTGKVKSDSRWRSSGFKSADRAEVRSKTFDGVADAMAEQWGNYLTEKVGK